MYIKSLQFSLWADFIEREYLDTTFRDLITRGIINGATSNPTIFKNAILTSKAYQKQIASLSNLPPKEKYEAIAIYDIQKAADILYPLFKQKDDGYVSIEVDPFLCDDAKATMQEAKRLYALIDRDNVMIKVPATPAGYEAMEELVASSIAVNATLVFSKEQAVFCAKAFQRGLARARVNVDTVISVFVSRIDRILDTLLKVKNLPCAVAGIYNASIIYETIEAMHIKRCKVLFASTGVRGDDLKPSYYIEKLLAFNSINTAPIKTIEAFIENKNHHSHLPIDRNITDKFFTDLQKNDIDFDAVLEELIKDGLQSFQSAFAEILENL